MGLSVLLRLAVVGVQTRGSIKLRTFDVGMRCSGDVETKTVHDSTVTVTNVVSSSTSSLMRLQRLLRVDTAKMTVPHGQQAGRPRVRMNCMKKRNQDVVDGCVFPLFGSLGWWSRRRWTTFDREERYGWVGSAFRCNVLRPVFVMEFNLSPRFSCSSVSWSPMGIQWLVNLQLHDSRTLLKTKLVSRAAVDALPPGHSCRCADCRFGFVPTVTADRVRCPSDSVHSSLP